MTEVRIHQNLISAYLIMKREMHVKCDLFSLMLLIGLFYAATGS
jgi:hypothetical protein